MTRDVSDNVIFFLPELLYNNVFPEKARLGSSMGCKFKGTGVQFSCSEGEEVQPTPAASKNQSQKSKPNSD
jgi:hypothetical protein